jgi:hypothetical protein
VRVRENYRVDVADILAERLCSEIGPSVHHKRAFRGFDINRGAQPVIARVGRPADIAIAADHRHTLRCSGTEKGHRKP